MKKLLMGLFLVLLTGLLLGYGASWYLQQDQDPAEEVRVAIVKEIPLREVQLYFVAPEGTFLVSEPHNFPVCDADRDCINSLLNGLINGSQQGNLPVLPKETKVLDVEIENDLVRVNFSRQVVDFHPGGSLIELFSIYSLTNSISENFPYVRQVQILVEGEVRQTLKGHVRIDQPIYADFSYNELPLVVVPPEIEEDNMESQDLSIETLIQESESQGNH